MTGSQHLPQRKRLAAGPAFATQNPIEQEGTYPCPRRNWTAS